MEIRLSTLPSKNIIQSEKNLISKESLALVPKVTSPQLENSLPMKAHSYMLVKMLKVTRLISSTSMTTAEIQNAARTDLLEPAFVIFVGILVRE